MLGSFCHKILSNPRVYDWVQRAVGGDKVRDRLMPILTETENQTVLDVGAGTGTLRAWLPPNCQYIWMDPDRSKLDGYLSRGGGLAVLGSATEIGIVKKSVDQAFCVAVAHHLDDEALERALHEIARVTKHRLVFLDAIDCSRTASRLLWSIDRGSFPRTPEVLRKFLEEGYVIERSDVFTVLHRYFLCVARPKC